MAPNGRIDEFPLPNPGSRPNSIIAAPDGKLWFTELGANRIGRLNPDGRLSEFTLPASLTPFDIAATSDGKVWATAPRAHAVCAILPDGRVDTIYLADTVFPGFIAAGPDGNLWFTEPTGKIGRLTVAGVLTEFPAAPAANSAAEASAPRHNLLIGSH